MTMPATVDPIETQPKNFFKLFVDMLVRPPDAFETIRDHPSRAWIVVLLLLILIAPIPTYLQTQAAMTEFAPSAEFVGEDVDFESFQPPAYISILSASGQAVVVLFALLLWSVLIFALASMMGGRANFGKLFQVATWAHVPLLFRYIFNAVYIGVTGTYIRHPNLSRYVAFEFPTSPEEFANFVPPSAGQQALYTLLTRLDWFAVWQVLLMGIGLAIVARMGKGKAFGIVLLLWLLGIAVAVVPILLSTSAVGSF